MKRRLIILTKSPMHKEINGELAAGVCVVGFCPENGRLIRLIQEPNGAPLNGHCVRQFSVMDEIEADISREAPAPPQLENALIPPEGISRIGRSSISIQNIEQVYNSGQSARFMDCPDAFLDSVAEYDHSVEIVKAENIRFVWNPGSRRPLAYFTLGGNRFANYRVTDSNMELKEKAEQRLVQTMDAAYLVISIPNVPFAKDGKYYKFIAAIFPIITNKTETENTETPEQILEEHFGYDSFRPGQREVIEHLMAGRDCLCVMPTGQGKSVCYQIPAVLLRGTALVISPLLSLMKDQAAALVRAGIPAACLNGTMDFSQQREVFENISAGKYKLVYTTPEKLCSPGFQHFCSTVRISLIAVDEAHCVSQWGPNFRYEYLRIHSFINQLPGRPVIGAFTATATEKVAQDICHRLQLRDPYSVWTGFDRPNLYFGVLQPVDKMAWLRKYMSEHIGKSGIIYCSTRSTVERVYESLSKEGYPVACYHAGFLPENRVKSQEDFSFDRKPVMIATNAFGMGIDKPNVSFVIHYNIPKSMEAYYQEAGRAGRDGDAADCILLYNPSDLITNRKLIEMDEPSPDLSAEEAKQVRQANLFRLNRMAEYAEGTDCLRFRILDYFGEKSSACFCGNCSNCKKEYEVMDAREQARMILSCVARTGQRYGKDFISRVLKGKATERLLRLGMDRQTTWGLMKQYSLHDISRMITELVSREYLIVPEGDYAILRLTEKSREMLSGNTPFLIRKMNSSSARRKQRAPHVANVKETDNMLFERLRAERNKVAAEEGVPPYIILDNKTLMEIAAVQPRDENEFLQVKGIGKVKAARYASLFLPLVRDYLKQQSGENPPE